MLTFRLATQDRLFLPLLHQVLLIAAGKQRNRHVDLVAVQAFKQDARQVAVDFHPHGICVLRVSGQPAL
jgi:hypothetical protein